MQAPWMGLLFYLDYGREGLVEWCGLNCGTAEVYVGRGVGRKHELGVSSASAVRLTRGGRELLERLRLNGREQASYDGRVHGVATCCDERTEAVVEDKIPAWLRGKREIEKAPFKGQRRKGRGEDDGLSNKPRGWHRSQMNVSQ